MARAIHPRLLALASAGLAVTLFAACGEGGSGTTPTPAPSATASTEPSATASPTAAPTATPSPTALAAIVIEHPAAGATVHSPFHVAGTADTFEAVFRLEVRTPSGTVLSSQQVQATSGTGTRGTFDATVTLSHTGPVVLVAYEVSPRDGSHVNQVSVAITMA